MVLCDSVVDENMPPAMQLRHRPVADNAIAAEVLARLHGYTTKPEYLTLAMSTVGAFEKEIEILLGRDAGYFASELVLAARYTGDTLTTIVIIGPRDDARSIALLREAKRIYRPAKTVQLLDPSSDMDLIGVMNHHVTDYSMAYVCVAEGYLPPVSEADQLRRALEVS